MSSVFFRVFLAQKFHHSCENYDTTALSSLNVNKKGPTLEQMPPNAFLYYKLLLDQSFLSDSFYL